AAGPRLRPRRRLAKASPEAPARPVALIHAQGAEVGDDSMCLSAACTAACPGARGRNRTGTVLPPADFESAASTSSATRAARASATANYGIRGAGSGAPEWRHLMKK